MRAARPPRPRLGVQGKRVHGEPPRAFSARIPNTRLDVERFGDGRAVLYHYENIIRGLCFSLYRQVLHLCMCITVPRTKVDGLENIEKRSPPLEVTLGSSIDTNLRHNQVKI